MTTSLRSLPTNDQLAIRERALEIQRQASGIVTMLEAVRQAREELGR